MKSCLSCCLALHLVFVPLILNLNQWFSTELFKGGRESFSENIFSVFIYRKSVELIKNLLGYYFVSYFSLFLLLLLI